MAHKKFWQMSGIVLALGFVLLGCPNGTTEKDTWSDVTDFSQLDGTWKGSYSQTMTMKEILELAGATWDNSMAAMFGDIKATMSAQSTVIYNAAEKTVTGSEIATTTLSGGNIDSIWPYIKGGMTSIPEEIGTVTVVPNDENYSIKMTIDKPVETMSDPAIADVLKGIQINQDGTKFKLSANKEAGTPEIIFTRQ